MKNLNTIPFSWTSTLLFLCLCMSSISSHAQTTRHVPATYSTIAAAISAASSGDIIQIANGLYTESGLLIDKSLTFRGGGKATTVIQGAAGPAAAPDRIFSVAKGIVIHFEKMTIRNGYARSGTNGIASAGGGAFYIDESEFHFREVCFIGNQSLASGNLQGGALYVEANTIGSSSTIDLCDFIENKVGTANDGGPDGGAIHVNGAANSIDIYIDSTHFLRNYSADHGGAIKLITNTLDIHFSYCSFQDNSAFDDGGALYTSGGAFNISYSTFENNIAETDEGGAIRLNLTVNCTIFNSTFYKNSAKDGGAIKTFPSPANTTLTLINNTFSENIASARGGAILIEGSGGPTIIGTVNMTNNLFVNSTGAAGNDIELAGGMIGTNQTNIVGTCTGGCPTFAGSVLRGLGTFDNHGGFTKTISLLSTTNAINVGTTSGAPADDQRGYPRISNPDLGAYEFGASPPSVSPTAVCQNLTVPLHASGNASIAASDIDGGSTGGVAPLSFAATQTSFTCSDIGINTLTLTVTDANSATATCTATVNISDVTPPTAICQFATVQIGAGGTATVTGATIDGGSMDACSGRGSALSRIADPSSFNCSQLGQQTVTLTVNDAPGNSASCSATVTVEDNTPPTATCSDLTVNLDANGQYTLTASFIHNAFNASDVCGLQSPGISRGPFFTCSDIGTAPIQISVFDNSSNAKVCNVNLTVADPLSACCAPPTARCKNATVALSEIGFAGVMTSDIDNGSDAPCGLMGTSPNPNSFGCHNIGPNTVQLTVTDVNNVNAFCTATVTIVDNSPPGAACVNVTVQLDANGNGSTTAAAVENGSTDNCGSVSPVNVMPNAFTCNDIGANPVTLTVTDGNGNSSSCSATATVQDNIAPTLSLTGGDPIVICEGDALVDPGATINDNCGSGTVQGNTAGVNTSQQGTYSITYNYTDPGGNAAAQISRTVIVERTPARLAPQNCGSCSQIRFDFCEGDPSPDLETLLQGNANYEAGSSFNWYADNSGSQGGAISSPSVNTTSERRRFYWVSQQDGNCESPARRVRVRVRATSTVVFNLPTLGCNTGQINLAAYVSDSRGKATGFSFFDSDPDVGNPTPLGSVTATNGVVDAGQLVVVTIPANPVTYYARADNNTGCQVTASDQVFSSAVATLDPISNLTVSACDLVHVAFSGTNITNIIWYDLALFNNPNIGIMGSLGLGNLMFTAQNATGSPLTATIRVIPYNGNCAGTPQDFTITVNPGSVCRLSQNSLLFTGRPLGADLVQLDWEIQYEFALTHVEVERLGEDDTWEKIAAVAWHRDQRSYAYVDNATEAESHTYRLKLVHADGRAIWSHEVEVSGHALPLQDTERFTLYPNPSTGRFTLRAAGPLEGEWRYKLSDQLGRTILIGKLQGSETAFDISQLPTAHYFLLLTGPEGKQYLERVVKN